MQQPRLTWSVKKKIGVDQEGRVWIINSICVATWQTSEAAWLVSIVYKFVFTHLFFWSAISNLQISGSNPYNNLLKTLEVNGKQYKYFDLGALGDKYSKWMLTFIDTVFASCFFFGI